MVAVPANRDGAHGNRDAVYLKKGGVHLSGALPILEGASP
jgi:hypothetical protein